MKKSKLGTQIFITSFLISIFALLIVTWYASSLGRRFFIDETGQSLRNQAFFVHDILSTGKIDFSGRQFPKLISNSAISIRTTIIDADGRVLADSEKDPRLMENHKNRPEIISARANGSGRKIRFSHTLQRKMMYVALRFKKADGHIYFIRTAKNLSDIEDTISTMRKRIIISGLVMALITLLIGFFVSRRITTPLEEIILGVKRIADGDFSVRLPKPKTREMALLSDSLNEMTRQIDEKLQTIMQK